MLKTSKSITLSGQSYIDGTQVANYSANIDSEKGSSNINSSIINQVQYDGNKVAVRKDLADFTTKVYEVEDQLTADTDDTANTTE